MKKILAAIAIVTLLTGCLTPREAGAGLGAAIGAHEAGFGGAIIGGLAGYGAGALLEDEADVRYRRRVRRRSGCRRVRCGCH